MNVFAVVSSVLDVAFSGSPVRSIILTSSFSSSLSSDDESARSPYNRSSRWFAICGDGARQSISSDKRSRKRARRSAYRSPKGPIDQHEIAKESLPLAMIEEECPKATFEGYPWATATEALRTARRRAAALRQWEAVAR